MWISRTSVLIDRRANLVNRLNKSWTNWMNLCASTAQRGALSPWFIPFYPLQTGERESWEVHTTYKAEFFTHQPNAWSDITLIMCACLSLEAFQWWAGNEYLIIWCKNEVRNAFKIVIQRVLYWENKVGEQWSQKSKSIVAIPCYYCTLVRSHSCKGLNNSRGTWVYSNYCHSSYHCSNTFFKKYQILARFGQSVVSRSQWEDCYWLWFLLVQVWH